MKKWDQLPEEMKVPQVRKYYNILQKKWLSLAVKRAFDIVVSAIMLVLFSPLFLVMLAFGPFVIYRFQRQYFVQENGMTEYSALWMHGILMVIYGALISGAVTLIVLQWVRPTLLYDQAQQFIDICNAAPEMKTQFGTFVDVVQKMIDEGLMPKPIEVVFSTFWMVTFSGSVLSAITAAFAGQRLRT